MHPDKVVAATRTVLDSLRQTISQDRQVRDAVGVITEWLNETVSWSGGADRSASFSAPNGRAPLDRGRPAADLGLVIRRTRLKAEACRWAIERQLLLDRGADRDEEIRPIDARFLEQARELRGCWLWMFDPYARTPEPAAIERLAVCYEALTAAIEIVEELGGASEEDPITLRDMYYLLAESQSMLWAALRDAGVDRDQDQTDAFIWLREKTREHRVFVERHMRREDPADPAKGADLIERLEEFHEKWRASLSDDRAKEVALNRLQYHVHRISENHSDEPTHDWVRLSEIIEELSELGVDPQDASVAELLAPLPDDVPDVEFSEPAERALNIETESA